MFDYSLFCPLISSSKHLTLLYIIVYYKTIVVFHIYKVIHKIGCDCGFAAVSLWFCVSNSIKAILWPFYVSLHLNGHFLRHSLQINRRQIQTPTIKHN